MRSFERYGNTWNVEWEEPTKNSPHIFVSICSVLARGQKRLMLFLYNTKNDEYTPINWYSQWSSQEIRQIRDKLQPEPPKIKFRELKIPS